MKSKQIYFFLLTFSFLFFAKSFAQNKKNTKIVKSKIATRPDSIAPYEIAQNGDTINVTDIYNQRQGKWLISTKAVRGEDATILTGNYTNNKKTGKWITYEDGNLKAIENYKKNEKDGECKYYDMQMLYCIANYKGLNTDKKKDTIFVTDPISREDRQVVLDCAVGSVKHGTWTYYFLGTHKIQAIQEYYLDELVSNKEFDIADDADSTNYKAFVKDMPHNGGNGESKFWIPGGKRTPVRFTDLPSNGKGIKPNFKRK